jgi:hypothetical protein
MSGRKAVFKMTEKKKKKYRVYGIISASKVIGTYEASSKEEAEDMANDDPNADWYVGLCYHCAHEVDIGDIYDINVEEIDD